MNATQCYQDTQSATRTILDRYYNAIIAKIKESSEVGQTQLHLRYEDIFPSESSISSAIYDNQKTLAFRLRELGYKVYLIPDSYYTTGGIRIAWGPNASEAFGGDRFAYGFFGTGLWLLVIFVVGILALSCGGQHR